MSGKILGISGSPVKEGNVQVFLEKMVGAVPAGTFAHETVHLSEYRVEDCIHCNFCLGKQKEGRYCALKDDAQEIFEKVESADIIVLASPVYFMRTSARMAALLDRLRVFIFGNLTRGRLRNKIGASAAVAWLRNGGAETTHLSHLYAFMTLEMIPVSVHKGVSPLGASAMASPHGEGAFDPAVKLGALEDAAGLHSAEAIMKRAVELHRLIRRPEEKGA